MKTWERMTEPITKQEADRLEARSRFMRALMEWGGIADRSNLGPQTSQAENAARQWCKRHGWVTYEGGYWRITDAGCSAFNWQRPHV